MTPFNEIDEAFANASTGDNIFSVEVEVRVGGRLDEGRLRAALARAASLHPMAGARQAPWSPADTRYHWQITGHFDVDPLVAVDCADDAELADLRDELQSLRVPIDRSPPFRALLVRRPDGDVLMLNIAHAATDGIGGVRLLQSIARAYAGHPDPLPPLDPLAARSLERLFAARWSLAWMDRIRALHQAQLDAWLAPPARILPEGGTDRPGYGVLHRTVPAEIASALRPLRFVGGTMNDLFLAAMSCAIERWNRAHGGAPGRVALLVAVNLRPKAWLRESVGNLSLSSAVSTWPEERRDPHILMSRIVAQTLRIKEDPAAAVLVDVYGGMSGVPISWKTAMPDLIERLTGDRFIPTAVVSNLGRVNDPISFGDGGEATEVWFSGSSRRPMLIGVNVVTYCGALRLSFRYLRAQLSAAAARRFADMFIDWMKALG